MIEVKNPSKAFLYFILEHINMFFREPQLFFYFFDRFGNVFWISALAYKPKYS